MIRLNIREVAERKGVKNAYQLAVKVGCSQSKAARLWNGGDELPKLETLDGLSAALECKLWDLITWKPNGTQKTRAAKGGRNGKSWPLKVKA